MTRFLMMLLATSLVVALTACGQAGYDQPITTDGDESGGLEILFERQTDGTGCPVSQIKEEQNLDKIPANVSALNLKLFTRTGVEITSQRVDVKQSCSGGDDCVLPGAESYTLYNVPEGVNMRLDVEALDGNDNVIWIGSNYYITVNAPAEGEEFQPVSASVFMRRVGDFTFGGNCLGIPRMWHTATATREGDAVLVVGGVAQIRDGQCNADGFGAEECDLGIGTTQVALFDVNTGDFVQMTPLNEKRAAHQAVLLKDGRILIIGGALMLNIFHKKTGDAYLQADDENIHKTAVIYTPNGQGSVSGPIDLNGIRRMDFTVTPIDGDPPDATSFLVAGGWGSGGRLSMLQMIQFNPGVDSSPRVRNLAISLSAPRSGHTATRVLGDGEVLFYGGAPVGDTTAPAAELYVRENAPTEPLTDYPNFASWPNLYHHAAVASKDENKVLISGGMQKIGANAFADPVNTAMLIDLSERTASQPNATMGTLIMFKPRAFHKIVPMPDGRALVVGGASTGADGSLAIGHYEIEVFDFESLKFSEFQSGGVTLELGVPRLGLSASMVRDGTWIFIGGLQPMLRATMFGSENPILKSAETFFPDPKVFLPDLAE